MAEGRNSRLPALSLEAKAEGGAPAATVGGEEVGEGSKKGPVGEEASAAAALPSKFLSSDTDVFASNARSTSTSSSSAEHTHTPRLPHTSPAQP